MYFIIYIFILFGMMELGEVATDSEFIQVFVASLVVIGLFFMSEVTTSLNNIYKELKKSNKKVV